ncbi:amino acid adenylation domain-containing protein [Paenibacillus oenotherae]|uniref:Amino acid adenylation domain-containing protein n=1 Tax=Paenibacillus oenotherae TaxID=1435645 RepID=A0ABS7D1N5_9BACL|nr:non-ribosomal peptide synthetase [Paenibacillus oenotherae]MBW7473805.1 amino acid adenylation domain-containing protein [Paenibacillus oenotherae]
MIDKYSQQMLLSSGRYEKEKQYWAQKLHDGSGMSEFPRVIARGGSASADKPSGNNLNPDYEVYTGTLDAAVTGKLMNAARSGHAMFMLLLSGVSYLMHRYTSGDDARIGVPVFKQSKDASELINTLLVIRTEYAASHGFRQWAGVVRQAVTEANENQNVPFLALAQYAQIAIAEDGTAEVPTMVMLEGVHDASYVAHIRSSLSFVFTLDGDRVDVAIRYDANRYSDASIASLAYHLESVLRAIECPDEPLASLGLLAPEERTLLLETFNNTARSLPQGETLHGLFEAQVRRSPEQPAVRLGAEMLTYRELNARANRLARTLRARGAAPDTVVAVVAERSTAMIVALLAVMKAGAAYLPVDPAYPEERIAYLLEDSRAGLVLAQGGHQTAAQTATETAIQAAVQAGKAYIDLDDEASYDEDDSDPDFVAGSHHLAYIIYTSGTTGLPKGVMVEHRGAVNSIQWRAAEYALTEQDVVLQLFSFSFDGFVTSFFTPIVCGATVQLLTEDESKDPLAIRRHIAACGVTHFICVPSLYGAVIEGMPPQEARSLRIVTVAGERITDSLIARSKTLAPQAELVNEYGPTETSVVATFCRNLRSEEPVTIGGPIANTRIYIVNEHMQLMPAGVPGELCVAGAGLARGYWMRPELTADKFVACPFEPGQRMYRTGDMARWLPDGTIDYMDRIDHQVKIRGYRIELGEIEAAILRLQTVKEAVVIAGDDAHGGKMLCAYITADDETALIDVRERLVSELPAYMVPRHIIQLERMPRLPNGKLDRKALPEPDETTLGAQEAAYEAPSDETEERLCAIWQELLGAQRIGIRDHFFNRGGHSLTAMMLLSQIHKAFGVEVPLRVVFESPTVADIASYIREQGDGQGSAFAAMEPVPARPYYPVSSAQKRMFVVSSLEGSGTSYNLPGVMMVEGELDVARLREAFRQLVARHETLRTSFASVEGEPVQFVEKDIAFDVPYSESLGASESEVDALADAFVRPFDLQQAPLFRAEMVKLGAGRHLLLYDMHHIISDGVSAGILVRELVALYQGDELAPLRVQYKDYAVWQQERLGSEVMQRQEQYWLNRFSGSLPVLDLPSDFPRPTVQSFEGGVMSRQASRLLLDRLQTLAKGTGTTLYMVLLAAYNVMLAKYSGKEDVVVGSPTAGRQHADTEPMIGMFVGTLALRNRPEGGRMFTDFLQEVKETTLEAFENGGYPFESLIEKLKLQRDISRNPLFDTMFILQNMNLDSPELPGLSFAPVASESRVSKFDLSFQAMEAEEGLLLSVEYSSALYREDTIERLIGHYIQILHVIADEPAVQIRDIAMITEDEQEQIVALFNDTRTDYPRDASIAALFRQQAELAPNHPALTHRGRTLTYRELDSRANALAHALQERGIRIGDAVGIYAERSLELVVGIMGILKAGAAFVTIDPSFPEERLRHMLEDSAATVCLKFEAEPPAGLGVSWLDLGDESLAAGEAADPGLDIAPNDLAYYMYTSGSTGKPKGVMVEQRNVIRLVKETNYVSFDADDRLLLTGSVSFDAIIYEIFGVLLNGLTLHVVDKDVLLNADMLADYIRDHKITQLWLTTSLFNGLSEYRPEMFAGIRQLIVGGEALSPSHVNRVRRSCGDIIINGYGPTENTTFSLTYPVVCDYDAPIPIGRPVSNSTVYVVDEAGYLQPIGVPGELVVGGDGVSRGYANLPEMTAEKFVENPFAPGERMYKTGDLGRWRHDGTIEYLGRIDQQVKIRGYRIELGEIEAAILQQPGIKEVCVLAKEDRSGQKTLCAYYVCDAAQEETGLRHALARELPSYMIPQYFTGMDRLPLTTNGKIDRRALPEPDWTAMSQGAEYTAPRTDTEKELAAIWADVLGVEAVGVYDDFFALGGHSLKAMTLIARMKGQFSVDVPLRKLFESPTVEALAAYIEVAEEAGAETIEPAPEQEYYPLSPAQKRLFVLSRFEGAGISYNLPRIMTIEGALDKERLQQAFLGLIARHEALRTSFSLVDSEPVQRIVPLEDIAFAIDLRKAAEEEVADMVDAFIRPFQLEQAPLLRVELIQLSAERHVLLCDMHHIIADGVSMSIFMKEFVELYEGAELTPLRIQYKDYAVWLNSEAGLAAMGRKEAFWLDAFAEEVPLLALPTDYPRPAVQSFKGATFAVGSGSGLKAALNEAAAASGATLFMVLLAAYNVLLHKYSGQDDIVVGTPVAGRTHSEVTPVIGMFVNTLALRGRPERTKTFRQLLDEVKTTTLGAFDNQSYPFDSLVEKLNLPRDLSRNPLFDTMFSLQNIDMDAGEMTGLNIEPFQFEGGAAKFDLSLEATETEEELVISFEYGTALFHHDTVSRMAQHYLNILREIADNPDTLLSEIELLTPEEKTRVAESFNATAADYPADATLHGMIEAQAARTPEAVAVIDGSRRLTYGELNTGANRLAARLRARGVGPDRIVPLMLERASEMIIGILAIQKAGGAYLPIDPEFPEDRIAYMLEDSEANWLLTQTKFVAKARGLFGGDLIDLDDPAVYADGNGANLPPIAGPRNLAYVIYTSGSTGQPKGVMIEHRAAVNRIHWMDRAYPLGASDVILQKTPYTFDVSVWELFWFGFAGAKMCFLKPGGEKNPEEIVEEIQRSGVTTMHFVPSMLSIFLDYIEGSPQRERITSLRHVFASGEALQLAQVKRFNAEIYSRCGAKLINLYGPTEAAVDVSFYDCSANEAAGSVPIGKPIDNIQLYVLDEAFRLQPIGVPGELCIAGTGLARGYVNKPELTAEKFVDNPYTAGTKMYRTGDLARWLPDGNIEYLGRLDFQVKIRGYRIELGEIETVLLKHEAIRETVVVALPDEAGGHFLCAYFTADASLHVTALREHLGGDLPSYMIPSQFVQLEGMPLSPNGKINRKALPKPDGMLATGTPYVAPRTPTEERLAAIWQETLGAGEIGMLDSFFTLGGHSLKAMTLIAAMHKSCGVELPLRLLFETPTIEAAARYIDEQGRGVYQSIVPAAEQELYAVSSAQKRMYLLDLFEGEGKGLAYNMPSAVILEGRMDAGRFEKALQALVARHEVLRTSFHRVNGEPMQRVHETAAFTLEQLEADSEDHAGQLLEEWFQPFDLASAPLLRAVLIRIADHRHLFAHDTHHIISDGVSGSIFMEELIALYEGEPLPERTLHYKDFALWQNEWMAGEAFLRQEQFWLGKLGDGDLPVLELPADYQRPAVKSFAGAVVDFEADPGLAAGLEALARDAGATLYMVLLAAYKVLLHKYSGQEDVIVGSPIAGRSHADTAGMLGMFVNSLAIRSSLDADRSFKETVSEVKSNALAAMEKGDYPFELLVEKLQLTRDLSRNPVFDTVLVWQNGDSPDSADTAGANAASLSSAANENDLNVMPFGQEHSIAKFDISLIAAPSGEGSLRLSLEYCTDLFREETIRRMSQHFLRILEEAVQAPERAIGLIALMTETEQAELTRFNDTGRELAGSSLLHGLFQEQAERLPEQPAIVQGKATLTYGQLNAKTNQLARKIRSLGVGSGDIVAVVADRTPEMVIGMIGIMKAGAAYLPIDPDYPGERIHYLLEDSSTSLLVARGSGLPEPLRAFGGRVLNLEDGSSYAADDSKPDWNVEPGDPAYIIYTSGTTGKPKGVVVEHGSISNTVKWRRDEFAFGPHDRALQVISFAFDASVLSLFTPLASGAASYIAPLEEAKDPVALRRIVADYGITHLTSVPNLFSTIIHLLEPHEAASLRSVILGGEPLPSGLAAAAKSKNAAVELVNEYGPTEGSVTSTFMRGIEPESSITIGGPIANMQVFIVNERLQLQPVGVRGELCIAGAGLARGYWNQPELTAEKFVPCPFLPGERMYRTGDAARWLPGGMIEYAGRIDQQVKVRGYRIELSEIEAVLLRAPGIREATVQALDDAQGHKFLCAYVAADNEEAIRAVKASAADELPAYMLPAHFVALPKLPVTPNGKIDTRALPMPDMNVVRAEYAAPRNDEETRLVAIWEELLGVIPVGIHDNFFEIGGNSLKATILTAQIFEKLSVEIPFITIFQHPTIAELTSFIARHRIERSGDRPVTLLNRPASVKRTIFCFPPVAGYGFVYQELAVLLEEAGVAVYGFDFIQDDDRIQKYVDHIRTLQPEGPYRLLGYSAGGNLAFGIARELEAAGCHVSDLIMLDAEPKKKTTNQTAQQMQDEVGKMIEEEGAGAQYGVYLQNETVRNTIANHMIGYVAFLNELDNKGKVGADIHFIESEGKGLNLLQRQLSWSKHTTGKQIKYKGAGPHEDMLEPAHLKANAELIRGLLC